LGFPKLSGLSEAISLSLGIRGFPKLFGLSEAISLGLGIRGFPKLFAWVWESGGGSEAISLGLDLVGFPKSLPSVLGIGLSDNGPKTCDNAVIFMLSADSRTEPSQILTCVHRMLCPYTAADDAYPFPTVYSKQLHHKQL
jgi:hypothetical protein